MAHAVKDIVKADTRTVFPVKLERGSMVAEFSGVVALKPETPVLSIALKLDLDEKDKGDVIGYALQSLHLATGRAENPVGAHVAYSVVGDNPFSGEMQPSNYRPSHLHMNDTHAEYYENASEDGVLSSNVDVFPLGPKADRGMSYVGPSDGDFGRDGPSYVDTKHWEVREMALMYYLSDTAKTAARVIKSFFTQSFEVKPVVDRDFNFREFTSIQFDTALSPCGRGFAVGLWFGAAFNYAVAYTEEYIKSESKKAAIVVPGVWVSAIEELEDGELRTGDRELQLLTAETIDDEALWAAAKKAGDDGPNGGPMRPFEFTSNGKRFQGELYLRFPPIEVRMSEKDIIDMYDALGRDDSDGAPNAGNGAFSGQFSPLYVKIRNPTHAPVTLHYTAVLGVVRKRDYAEDRAPMPDITEAPGDDVEWEDRDDTGDTFVRTTGRPDSDGDDDDGYE